MARKANRFLMMMVCLLFAADARAISGNDWKQLRLREQQIYVMGVIDTWMNLERLEALSLVQAPSPAVAHQAQAVNCVRQGVTYEQAAAIVQKYMENNPSNWHYAMPSLVWSALSAACPVTSK
jgi:hypothetical protein